MGVPVAVTAPAAVWVWVWLTALAKRDMYAIAATIMTRIAIRPVPASRIKRFFMVPPLKWISLSEPEVLLEQRRFVNRVTARERKQSHNIFSGSDDMLPGTSSMKSPCARG